jgi:hypothetical protein
MPDRGQRHVDDRGVDEDDRRPEDAGDEDEPVAVRSLQRRDLRRVEPGGDVSVAARRAGPALRSATAERLESSLDHHLDELRIGRVHHQNTSR